MVFSDPKFLFLLLPIALVAGLLTRRSPLFSPVILVVSLVFFYWTSGAYTLLLIASIVACRMLSRAMTTGGATAIDTVAERISFS